MLNEDINEFLKKTAFIEKYKILVEKHSYSKDVRMYKVDFQKVEQIIESLGYAYKFYKKEQFFKVLIIDDAYKIGYNVTVKYGLVEFIMLFSKENINVGGPISLIISESTGDPNLVKKPGFCTYKELCDILLNMFQTIEEYKEELNGR